MTEPEMNRVFRHFLKTNTIHHIVSSIFASQDALQSLSAALSFQGHSEILIALARTPRGRMACQCILEKLTLKYSESHCLQWLPRSRLHLPELADQRHSLGLSLGLWSHSGSGCSTGPDTHLIHDAETLAK
jgi:hypothetical protein